MTYLVLARKWRPRSFDTLIGQDHVVRALTHALSTQRLHHAWLFTGTRGVGKTTLSRILAKSLNCETGITATPCGTCQACTEIDTGRFVDYVELDAASNRGVDEMTQLLEQAVYSPSSGRFKVYMIDEVHMLTGHAFNAMLKTLEEPPPHVKFILATTDPQKIPVTVLSRCLQFNLKQMAAESIVGHLQHILHEENVPFQLPALRLLAQAAAGSMRDALSLTDQAIAYSAGNLNTEAVQGMLGTIDQGHLVQLLQALSAGNAEQVLNVANQLSSRGFSYSGALADLAVLLSRVAIEQRVPGALPADDPLVDDIRSLAALMHADQIQLFYSVAVHSRNELSLAPDEYAGFVMACLRMLSLGGADTGAPTPPAGRAGNQSSPAPAGPAAVADHSGSPVAASAQSTASAHAAQPVPVAQGTSLATGQAVQQNDAHPEGSGQSGSDQPGNGQSGNGQPTDPTVGPGQPLAHEPPAGTVQSTPPADSFDEPPPWEDAPQAGPHSEAHGVSSVPSVVSPAESEAHTPEDLQHTGAQYTPTESDQNDDFEQFHSAGPDASGDDFDPASQLPIDASDFDGFEPVDDDFGMSSAVSVLSEKVADKPAALRSAKSPARMKSADWPALAASLPVTGLASELARQSEWLGLDGDYLVLKVAIRSLAESAAQVRLQTVLSEHFGSVIKLRVQVGVTGDDTAHAVDQARKAALQQQAEQAAQNDPFVQELLEHFHARIVPGSIRAAPDQKAA